MEQQTQEASLAVAEPYVGQWRNLVSTTNWEKGRIIHEWRTALIDADAPQTEYSDEAWSKLVGGSVTGQHSGRLRRVYERFGDSYRQYNGLFWSHFQSAIDWEDAEMWLEGAVQNSWSISVMRRERWETRGAIESEKPSEQEVVAAESDVDEDCNPKDDSHDSTISGSTDYVDGAIPEGPDFGDEDDHSAAYDSDVEYRDVPDDSQPAVQPFENLPELPDDLNEAFESFKLAILRHKSDEWKQIPQQDVLMCLDSLKALATAP
ncbi:MAG: hypothetical protein KDB27_10025 [Planctomycetales bacterium]|nr:hypothetical protein [Planctomycetales bacterium]